MSDKKLESDKPANTPKVSDRKLLVGIAALLVLMFVLMGAIVLKITSGS